jgi:hypothetical protein
MATSKRINGTILFALVVVSFLIAVTGCSSGSGSSDLSYITPDQENNLRCIMGLETGHGGTYEDRLRSLRRY